MCQEVSPQFAIFYSSEIDQPMNPLTTCSASSLSLIMASSSADDTIFPLKINKQLEILSTTQNTLTLKAKEKRREGERKEEKEEEKIKKMLTSSFQPPPFFFFCF